MSMSLEEFFTLIRDGTWHNIEELSNELDLPPTKLMKLSNFLSQHGLVKYEEDSNRLKLKPKWKLLLPEEARAMRNKCSKKSEDRKVKL
jgi:predicted transcriptional regulator